MRKDQIDTDSLIVYQNTYLCCIEHKGLVLCRKNNPHEIKYYVKFKRCSAWAFLRAPLQQPQLINCNGAWIARHIEEGTTPYKYVRPLLNAYAHEVVAEGQIFTKRAGGSPAYGAPTGRQFGHG